MLPLSLCGLAQAWSVRGTPSRGGPGGSSLAGLRGRTAGTGRSGVADSRGYRKHGEFAQGMYMCEIPSLCSQGMYMCSLKGPFCDVCRARGPSLGGPGGWFLCPLAMAHCRLAGGAHREVPWCAHRGQASWVCTLGRKAPGNDQTLCPRVPGNDQTLCLRGLGGPKLFIRAHPLVLRTRILSGTRGEARGCWEESPKEVGCWCWCLLWRAFFRCQPGREREVRRRETPFLATARRHAGARSGGGVLPLLAPRL